MNGLFLLADRLACLSTKTIVRTNIHIMPVIGRITVTLVLWPILFPWADQENPQSLNLYGYVKNDPQRPIRGCAESW
jgi:hypothetical protein